jgi:hypothetical protein
MEAFMGVPRDQVPYINSFLDMILCAITPRDETDIGFNPVMMADIYAIILFCTTIVQIGIGRRYFEGLVFYIHTLCAMLRLWPRLVVNFGLKPQQPASILIVLGLFESTIRTFQILLLVGQDPPSFAWEQLLLTVLVGSHSTFLQT